MEAKKRLLWKFRGGWLSILETGLEGDGLEQGFPGKWLFGSGEGGCLQREHPEWGLLGEVAVLWVLGNN